MKCITAVDVNLEHSPIGTRSRAADEILGEAVLPRTLKRLGMSEKSPGIFVICPESQVEACSNLVPGELRDRVTVRPARVQVDPYRNLIRTARKWSLDAWRGGLGGTTSIDEYARSDELAILAHEQQADCVVAAPACAPLIDAKLIDELIEHADATDEEARMTFAQAPPGLVGTVFRTDLLLEMGQKHVPPGFVMSYKPDAPMMDLAHKSCCFTASQSVRYAAGRLIVDTDRACDTVTQYLESGRPVDAESVAGWLVAKQREGVGRWPLEVEIELTTDDQLPNALLRPRGSRVPSRGPLRLDWVEGIAAELAQRDDALVVLGGFGDPLLHPKFDDVLGILKSAGIYGIAVRTNGLALDEVVAGRLIDREVDVLNVIIDAWSPELYAKVQGADRYGEVRQNLTRLAELKRERPSVAPLVVPEMTKSVETRDEMEAFFDGWLRDEGWANLRGYSHYAGQLQDRAVMSMCPPTRFACQQIQHRATILADGSMIACDQDFAGRHPIGHIAEASIEQLWTGRCLSDIRQGHRSNDFTIMPLCGGCDEWHRP